MQLKCKIIKVGTPYFYINPTLSGLSPFLAKFLVPQKWLNFSKVPCPPLIRIVGGGVQLWRVYASKFFNTGLTSDTFSTISIFPTATSSKYQVSHEQVQTLQNAHTNTLWNWIRFSWSWNLLTVLPVSKYMFTNLLEKQWIWYTKVIQIQIIKRQVKVKCHLFWVA